MRRTGREIATRLAKAIYARLQNQATQAWEAVANLKAGRFPNHLGGWETAASCYSRFDGVWNGRTRNYGDVAAAARTINPRMEKRLVAGRSPTLETAAQHRHCHGKSV